MSRAAARAEEEGDRQAADGKHRDVFAEEEQSELEPAVFREVTGDDFALGFR